MTTFFMSAIQVAINDDPTVLCDYNTGASR